MRGREFRLGVVVSALMINAMVAAQAVQWTQSAGGNGHWYQVVVEAAPINWSDARSTAELSGGHLAAISSAAENAFAHDLSTTAPGAWVHHPTEDWTYGPWLGGFREGRGNPVWKWVTGESWSYTNWYPTQPDSQIQNAVSFGPDPAQATWADTFATGEFVSSYIIEWDADCNGDGVVDYGQIASGELTDANANGIPDCCELGVPCHCPGDINVDGNVNGADLSILLGYWGPTSPTTPPGVDINGSGAVDGADLAMLLAGWGSCP